MCLCGYVALLLFSYVAMWLYGYMAMWLCGYVAKFQNFKISKDQKVGCTHAFLDFFDSHISKDNIFPGWSHYFLDCLKHLGIINE